MKKNWRNNLNTVLVLFALVVLALGTSCNGHKHAEQADTYTCPMHPTVISDKQGNCPVCGMDLVRKAREGEEVKITEDLAKLIKSPNEVVASSMKTIKATYKAMDVTVEGTGVVTYDSRNVYTIPARIGGRLDKVYLRYVYQPVTKGMKIAEIYSPELVTAQRELLFLLRNDRDNSDLIESSKNKLYLLGATQRQVEELVNGSEPSMTFAIYSPYSGYVINAEQQAPAVNSSVPSASSMNGMSGKSSVAISATNAQSEDLVRAGSYISAGQTLFKVVNIATLFVELNLPISQAGAITVNEEVMLDLGGGNMHKTKVGFVQPYFEGGVDFVKVRIYLTSATNVRIGQLVKANMISRSQESLWIPKEAMVDLGVEKIVFVKDREVFKARNVITGTRSDGWIEIKQGLSSADELASNAQFLVDSESFIKSK